MRNLGSYFKRKSKLSCNYTEKEFMTVQLKPVGYYWNYFLHANEEQLKL